MAVEDPLAEFRQLLALQKETILFLEELADRRNAELLKWLDRLGAREPDAAPAADDATGPDGFPM